MAALFVSPVVVLDSWVRIEFSFGIVGCFGSFFLLLYVASRVVLVSIGMSSVRVFILGFLGTLIWLWLLCIVWLFLVMRSFCFLFI